MLSKEGRAQFWREVGRKDIPRNCLISFILFGVGDTLAQNLEKVAAPSQELNCRRLAGVSACGVVINGCMLTTFYHTLDFYLGAASLATYWPLVPLKVVLSQLLYMPVSAIVFHFSTVFFETGNAAAGKQNVREKFKDTYISGWLFWAPLDVFTFALLDPNQRVVFDGFADIIWNTYLSWKAHSVEGDSFLKILPRIR